MTPAAIDRVFGRGRLRMVTGDHVEVFREAALPGERRRYTKRFLATPDGDFRQWTEREWRILARLVGHGIGPVPDVVQFDRGADGRQALVQTYDAGVTIDHWTTLLPMQRDDVTLAHVFEDCAHWWALARHSLIALDAIHALQLVHLDLKADNVCIPVGPADFDTHAPGARLFPDFERIALIDFAFSLVSGEPLASALPIARQTEYDYQSPRLLQALEEGSRGNLWPTRQLDWRCDLFSLAAMLRRYLPDPEQPVASGWTDQRHALARALVRRLLEAHDAELPARRPHAELAALAAEPLRDPELGESLQRGWALGERVASEGDDSPTPITRIALPVSPPADAGLITIDPSDVAGWAAANHPRPRGPGRRVAWALGLVALAAVSVPLVGEAWHAFVAPGGAARGRLASAAPLVAAAPAQAVPAPPVAAAPVVAAPVVATPAPTAAPESPPVQAIARAAEPAARRVATTGSSPVPPWSSSAARAVPAPRAGTHPSHGVAAARGGPVPAARPAPFPLTAKASARPQGHLPIYLPPAVGLAPLPSFARAAASAPPVTPAPAVAVAAPAGVENNAALPPDFTVRANELLATQIPLLAQRAERMVLRVLFAAAHADQDGHSDDDVRLAAGAIRLAPDDPQLLARTASKEARAFHEAARVAFRRGDVADAVSLQTRAFGANPVDAEIAGSLAFLRLKQSPMQPEAARRLALHALTLHDWKHPAGRIEDWNTLAIASALSGHERDARNAWLVALALAGDSERQCRAAIDAYALYGEPLRTPVEAMLYRANAAPRSQRSRLCEWPPHWSASTQLR